MLGPYEHSMEVKMTEQNAIITPESIIMNRYYFEQYEIGGENGDVTIDCMFQDDGTLVQVIGCGKKERFAIADAVKKATGYLGTIDVQVSALGGVYVGKASTRLPGHRLQIDTFNDLDPVHAQVGSIFNAIRKAYEANGKLRNYQTERSH